MKTFGIVLAIFALVFLFGRGRVVVYAIYSIPLVLIWGAYSNSRLMGKRG